MSRAVDPEARAARFIDLEQHEETHDRLVWGMRHHRDVAAAAIPEWERLRGLASQIKEHTPASTCWRVPIVEAASG